MKLVFPNQLSSGAHINISGAGILKYAPNVENANLFIEFLLSDSSAREHGRKSYEYPIAKVPISDEMASFETDFKEDNASVKKFES